MPISLTESQAIKDLAKFLYDFLPGTPFGDALVSFPGAAQAAGLTQFWQGGSKLPAVRALLESTLSMRRDKFCDLIVSIVQKGIAYRTKKNKPLTRDEIQHLNDLIAKLSFKIPELWNPQFLDALPRASSGKAVKPDAPPDTGNLKQDFMARRKWQEDAPRR